MKNKMMVAVAFMVAAAYGADPVPVVTKTATNLVSGIPAKTIDWISNFTDHTEIGGGYGAFYSHGKLEYGAATFVQANLYKGKMKGLDYSTGLSLVTICGQSATREGVGVSLVVAFQPLKDGEPAPLTLRQRVVHTLTGARGFIEAGILVDEPTAPQICGGLSFKF